MNYPCNMVGKSQMLLRKTIQKSKFFFCKTFLKLKSYLFAGYQKLPKAPIINNVSSGGNANESILESDYLCRKDCDLLVTDHDMIDGNGVSNNVHIEGDVKSIESLGRVVLQIDEKIMTEERNEEDDRTARSQEGIRGEGSFSLQKLASDSINIRGEHSSGNLAKKLKELEMMDVNDVDHVMDIEEVLHYYSRLTCPVYLDMVDKLLVEMCHDTYFDSLLCENSSLRKTSQCADSVV